MTPAPSLLVPRRAATLPGLIAAAVSGAALGAAFPSLGWDWMAWFALVPLLIVVARADNGWRALWPGYLAGAAFFGVSCPWILATVRNYGGLSLGVASFVFLLFLGLMGSYLALFAWLGYWVGRRMGHRLLPLPFLWVAVELLRTYTPMGGFPWNLLGYSQVQHPGFMLVAPIAGIFGASFLIVLVNTLVAGLALNFYERRSGGGAGWPGREDAVMAVGLGLILAFATLPYHPPAMPVRTLRARLVQPDTQLDTAWTAARLGQFLDAQEKLSAQAATAAPNDGRGPQRGFPDPAGTTPGRYAARPAYARPGLGAPWPQAGGGTPFGISRPFAPTLPAEQTAHPPRVELVVWPEQPAPLDYALQPGFQAITAEMIAHTHASFLFGEVTYGETPQGTPDFNTPRNSALLIHADGTTGQQYDKLHLVPFGEYVPLPAWMQRWAGIGKLVQGVGDFVPGRRIVLFQVDGHHFATLICYESIFPALARAEVAQGAEWLVNQSDDTWYGHSSAAAQGLMMAQARAIENRRWLLRDTNDGITAAIDPYGRITAELPRGIAASLEAGFSPETGTTFYTRHGDWLAYGCCIIALGLGLLPAVGSRRKG